MEMASDSLHDIRGWKKVVKNLGAYDFNLLYKYVFMIKWTGFEFLKAELPQDFWLCRNSS